MNLSLIRILILVLATVGAATPLQAKPPTPTIAQLAAFPRMSSFSLSPDGKHMAALEARGEDRVILVWDTDALDKPPTVIGSTKMKLQGVSFIKVHKGRYVGSDVVAAPGRTRRYGHQNLR
jgi:hypothetical protein